MAETQEQLHFLDYWRVVQSRKEIVIAVFLLVALTGLLVTYTMPKVYMASTVIQVKEETPDVSVFGPQAMRFDPHPLFLRTQFEIIQSRPVIEEAVRRLNLDEKLGRAYGYLDTLGRQSFDQTVKIVSKSMKVQQYRDTNLIEIRVYLAEPKETVRREVAEAANTVAEVYRNQNMKRSREVTERALAALLQSLEEQRTRVTKAQQDVEDVRKKYKITLVNSSMGTGTALGKMSIGRLESLHVDLNLEVEDKRARYEKFMGLKGDKRLDAAPYMAGDAAPALAALVADRRRAEVRLSELTREALGPKHPDVVRIQATIKEIEAKTGEALQGLQTGMQADYEAATAKFQALQKILGDMKSTDIDAEAEGYHEYDKAQQELEYARRIRDALEMRYLQERIELRIPRTTVEVVDPAKAPDVRDPVSPKFLLNAIMSVLVGLGAGIGLAFFVEYLDTSVKTIEDIERFLQLPMLGVIPQKVKPLIEETGESAHAEAYRVLRTNIQFSKRFKDGRTLCVTSGSVGEGKSLTLFNLAYTCAQLGDKVLVVDSDLHRPRQHKILGIPNRIGLANILAGETTLDESVVHTEVENFDFLPSGKLAGGIHGLLDNARLKTLIAEFKERYKLILFDAPPMIGVSDTSLLVREMDGVMLVVQHRKYPRSVSSRAKAMVQDMGANLVGVVLNNINVSRDYSYYYYHQHYYYYPKGSEGDASGKTQV